jgi:hypothetical protein
MLGDLEQNDGLYQDAAVGEIMERFGEEHAWYNDNGNPAIEKRVLTEFGTLTVGTVVWIKSYRMWRHREDGDLPGREQP